jgi:hypothetical protein
MRVDIDLTNFTAGEMSPRMKGRYDEAKYFNGSDTQLNFVTLPQGGVTRRPGTLFAALNANQGDKPRLKGFIFSTLQAYMLEFSIVGGVCQVRVFMDDGLIVAPGGGSVVVTGLPYTQGELAELGFTQSADTLYIFHPSHPQATLTRSSHTDWSYQAMQFFDGPYLDLNGTTTTLTPSGTTGSITITASSIVGVNATPQSTGQGFLASDVGRMLRIKLTSCWAWCIITGVASPVSIAAVVQPMVNNGAWGALDGGGWSPSVYYEDGVIVDNGGALFECIIAGTSGSSGPTVPVAPATSTADGTVTWEPVQSIPSATTFWRLGAWAPALGYPGRSVFWQQRLVQAGTTSQPNGVWGSVSGDFTNNAPSQQDGTVVDINAFAWVISDNQVNAVRWLSPVGAAQAMQLGIGTLGAEHVMQAATTAQALTPTSVQVYQETAVGSAENVDVLRIVKSGLFADRPGRKVWEWTFQWAVNGYVPVDLTELSEHITRSAPPDLPGIVQMVYQQSPHSVVWAIKGDGGLIGCTYQRDQNIVAWHRHQLGGDFFGAAPVVESIEVIPSPDTTYDEVWLAVLRTINGVEVRTIEVMTRYFDAQPLDESWFVDCALSSPLTYPAATLSLGGISGAGMGFAASGNVFNAASVGSLIRANGGLAIVRTYQAPNFVICDWYQPARDQRPAFAGAWSCTPQFSHFSNLTHLVGQTVAILGDGADLGTAVVSGAGVVVPSEAASCATVGLPYAATLVTMPFEPQRAAAASTQGKSRRVDTMYLRIHEGLGADHGRRVTDPETGAVEDVLEPLETRSASDPMGQAPPAASLIQRLKLPGGYDQECQIMITTSSPHPLTVLAISAKAGVGEMPNG